MSEIKLHWEEFVGVWNRLIVEHGKDPSIQRLRQALGKGSIARITTFKERAIRMRELALSITDSKLPNPLIEAATTMYNRIIEKSEENEKLFMADIDKQRKGMEAEVSDLQEKNRAADKTITELTGQLDAATTEAETLQAQVHELTLKLSNTQGQLEKANALNTQLSKDTVDLKKEFKEHLAAEQGHTLDAKQQLAKAQDDKAAADKKHTAEVATLNEQQTKARQALKDETVKMNSYYEQQLKTREEQTKALKVQCKTANDKLAEQAQDIKDERETNKELTSQLATSTRKTEKLQDKLENLTASLSAANDAIKEVKDEKEKLLVVMSNIKVQNDN